MLQGYEDGDVPGDAQDHLGEVTCDLKVIPASVQLAHAATQRDHGADHDQDGDRGQMTPNPSNTLAGIMFRRTPREGQDAPDQSLS